MGFPATVQLRRRTEHGWEDFLRLHATLEQVPKTALPPRGGHTFSCPAAAGVTPGMRADVGGRWWDVLKVEPSETAFTDVVVTLGQGESSPGGRPTPFVPTSRVRVELLDESGKARANVFAERKGDTLTLLHDYPDLRPLPGWATKGRGFLLRITAADGKTLACEPLEVA